MHVSQMDPVRVTVGHDDEIWNGVVDGENDVVIVSVVVVVIVSVIKVVAIGVWCDDCLSLDVDVVRLGGKGMMGSGIIICAATVPLVWLFC